MTDREQIARVILSQLGGNKFIAMTGARNFSHGIFAEGPGLSMRLPATPKGRFTALCIELTPADTYTMTFCRSVPNKDKTGWDVVSEKRRDIYNDMLQEVFTRVTGLDTHL